MGPHPCVASLCPASDPRQASKFHFLRCTLSIEARPAITARVNPSTAKRPFVKPSQLRQPFAPGWSAQHLGAGQTQLPRACVPSDAVHSARQISRPLDPSNLLLCWQLWPTSQRKTDRRNDHLPLYKMSASLPGSRELPESRYDLSTYWGRVRQTAGITDPR